MPKIFLIVLVIAVAISASVIFILVDHVRRLNKNNKLLKPFIGKKQIEGETHPGSALWPKKHEHQLRA